MKKTKWLLSTIHICLMVGFTFAMSHHIADLSWPQHARNHAFQATVWLVGLHLVGVVILWNAYPQKWAWFTLLMMAVLFFGGYFAALLVIPESGAPGITDDIIIGGCGVVYIMALALNWRNIT